MTRRSSAILLCVLVTGGAVPAAGFSPPKPYPMDRYAAGWAKNPFTLKAAPVVAQRDSFAKDLALAGWRQAGDDIIVILVNTQTREYLRLKNNEPAPNGISVKTAHLQDKHADSFVDLLLHGETATVRYDENFNHQMAAKSRPANGQQGHANAGPKGLPAAGGQPQPVSGAAPPNATATASPSTVRAVIAPPGPQNAPPVFPTNDMRMKRTLPRPAGVPQ